MVVRVNIIKMEMSSYNLQSNEMEQKYYDIVYHIKRKFVM